MKILFSDFRAAGVCRNARTTFFVPHGLNWRDFLKNGIEENVLRSFGDQLDRIDKLAAAARAREAL
ncbi:MAG: hypothetical protein ABI459_07495 [Deltaproteobacteria bacterium]